MRNKIALFSMFLLALFLLLTAPPAKAAATASCQDNTAVTIDGTVKTLFQSNKGAWLFVEAPAWDCGRVLILAAAASNCRKGSSIHASGVLSEHPKPDPYAGWILSDAPSQTALGYASSFSCN